MEYSLFARGMHTSRWSAGPSACLAFADSAEMELGNLPGLEDNCMLSGFSR